MTQLAQVDVSGHAWVAGSTYRYLDGKSNWDVFLMKFDAQGVHQWTRHRGGESYDFAYALQADGAVPCFADDLVHGGKLASLLCAGKLRGHVEWHCVKLLSRIQAMTLDP